MITSRILGGVSAAVLAVACATVPAHADQDLPFHHVKYTLTAAKPIYAEIYYMDHEPAVFADWSHNPYEFMPNIEADLGPNQPVWTYELDLQKPEDWAMVIANRGGESTEPNFHCELAVDGKVVVSKDGPKGVLCSIRRW